MRELFAMWSNTRMVVLTAICAALYAAILIPFKVVPLIPGITEFRPANAVPVVCSFLFGPAAAWGSAFGNLIGDFFGGLGPGDFFGFWANFLYGLVPYLDLLGPRPAQGRWRTALGVALATAGTGAAFVAGELIASGRWLAPWAPYRTATGAFEVGLGLVPLIGLAIAGLALL